MPATVDDIIKVMETIAPSYLAEEWDNVGLQIGKKDWPVRTVWVALDPTPKVVAAACRKDVDLLVTHHPLLFRPLRSIDFSVPVCSIIHESIQHQMAIFAAHTNLDNAIGGTNDVLASKIGLKSLEVLRSADGPDNCKLVVYVPVEYEQKVLNSLFETKAGEIGVYTCCSFRNKGKGTFRPGPSAKPFIGKIGEVSHTDEIRIETVVQKKDLKNVIEHIRSNHPYETMAYDVYPLLSSENIRGLGRIGSLDKKTKLSSFALNIKEKLGLKSIRVAGKPDLLVDKVAVCTGSGSSLMNDFLASKAQVYISGDLRYHDARDVEAADLGLIDIGHFASEHLIVGVLADRVKKKLFETGIDINVEACGLEDDPFVVS